MTEHEPWLDGIFTAHDVHVGAADRRRCNPDDRLARAGYGLGHFLYRYPTFSAEDHGFHRCHTSSLFGAGSVTFTVTGIPRLTLSVTMQKSSNSCSQRCRRGRSSASTSGASSTSMPLMRKRPARCARRGRRPRPTRRGLEPDLPKAEGEAGREAVADGSGEHGSGVRAGPSPSGGGSSNTIGGSARCRGRSPRIHSRARSAAKPCSRVFQT